jgi:hypothetical protein
VSLIGRADNLDALGALTLRWAVALLCLRIVAVNLHKLRVVDVRFEGIGHGVQIHLMAVRGQLDAIRQTRRNVLKELCRTPGIPPANHPTDNELGLSLNRRERPNISADPLLHLFRRDLPLLATHKTPDLIDLNALRGNVADNGVLVLRASLAETHQQTKDSALRYAGHADGRTDGASFDQRRNDRYLLLRADYVCHNPIVRQRFRIVNRKTKKDAVLGGFLRFGPPRFRGLPSAPASLFVGHGFKPTLAADAPTLSAHVAHDLLNDGKLYRLCGFNGFQENALGVLDRIEFWNSACPLWHIYKRGTERGNRQEGRISNRPTTGSIYAVGCIPRCDGCRGARLSQGNRLMKDAVPNKWMKSTLFSDIHFTAQFFFQIDKQPTWEPGRRTRTGLDQ